MASPTVTDRADAERADASDPLPAGFASTPADERRIYLDGNSLGRLPLATRDALRAHVEDWATRLVSGWPDWIDEPTRTGDLIAEHVIGARPGEVLVCDSVSVNLFKLASAALAIRPGAIVTDPRNFPTDRYVLGGLGHEVRAAPPTPDGVAAACAGGGVGLVSLSHVDYRTGEIADLPAITEIAHAHGALVLWDLCHSAGAVEVELSAAQADLAVGCTYKHLCAGPGAPAFLHVRHDLIEQLTSPIHGWFGQRDQFEMDEPYAPAPGIARFLAGTPHIAGIVAVRAGVETLAAAGIKKAAARARALTDRVVALHDAWLQPLGFTLGSPRDARRRGAHVALRHPDGYRICRALIEQAGVIPDFRPPDVVRLGVSPLSTTHTELHDAMQRLRDLVAGGAHERLPTARSRVT